MEKLQISTTMKLSNPVEKTKPTPALIVFFFLYI